MKPLPRDLPRDPLLLVLAIGLGFWVGVLLAVVVVLMVLD